VLVPGEDYTQRDFLRDGLRAFWHKVRWEHRLYWPKYSGITVYIFRFWKNKRFTQEQCNAAMERAKRG
jgi:hypothetical protein